ncbi:MAG TPA: site-specific integrase [Nitrospiraceae bacterium]|nr:site-specific integrase [Nitrospiraceae bacterium]
MGLYKRHRVWWMSFTYNGEQIRRSTGTTNKRLAEAICSKVRVKIIEGQYFDRGEEQDRTVGEMMERYFRERVAGGNRHSERRARSILTNLRSVFGSKTLAAVTPKEIATYKANRHQQGAKPATIAKELGLMKAAYNVAIREWEWCRENPVCRVMFGRIRNARVRYLDDGTFERVVKACPAWLQPIVLIARYTGMRRENVVMLQWSQVDLHRKLIVLESTKNGDRLGVPLCDPVMTILQKLRGTRLNPFGPVFTRLDGEPLTGDAVGIAFGRVCRRIGIEDFRFHDLRHTFASSLVQQGVDLYHVQRLLGHRDGRMTQRYAHLAPENLRDAIQVFNRGNHKISTQAADRSESMALSPWK